MIRQMQDTFPNSIVGKLIYLLAQERETIDQLDLPKENVTVVSIVSPLLSSRRSVEVAQFDLIERFGSSPL